MNIIQKSVQTFDTFQRRQPLVGFVMAVIKKYGEDQAGYQAALLTYYGFLALFPLLLVLTTIAGLIAGRDASLQHTIISSLTTYFPILGSQLSDHIHGLHKTGLALVIGIVLTIYGARGVAGVFRIGVNKIWGTSDHIHDNFISAIVKNLSIILVGGIGFMLASIVAGYAGAVGHGLLFRSLSIVINIFILYWLFIFLLNVSLPKHVALRETMAGAAVAAIGLVILQSVGSYLLARELKNLDALYSSFALTLSLLFWIYLQAQLLYYAVVVATVRSEKLWPRAIDGKNPTLADKRMIKITN